MVYHGLSWFIMVYHGLSWFIISSSKIFNPGPWPCGDHQPASSPFVAMGSLHHPEKHRQSTFGGPPETKAVQGSDTFRQGKPRGGCENR